MFCDEDVIVFLVVGDDGNVEESIFGGRQAD